MNDIDNDKTDLVEDEGALRQKVSESEGLLDDLESELGDIDAELEALARRRHEFDVLGQV